MPSLARKIQICAAADGLVLHPLPSKKDQRLAPSAKIRFGDTVFSTSARDQAGETTRPSASFEAFGIVGLVNVAKFSFLISITKRQQVATIRGSPVYVVTEVALTPCTSYGEALGSVEETAQRQKRRHSGAGTDGVFSDDDSDDSDHDDGALWPDDIGEESSAQGGDDTAGSKTAVPTKGHKSSNSIAEDVMSRRGSYGRFAQRWFSRGGWLQEQKRLMGLSGDSRPVDVEEDATAAEPAATPVVEPLTTTSQVDGSSAPETTSSDAASITSATDAATTVPTAATSATATATTNTNPPSDTTSSTPRPQSSTTEHSAVASLLPKLLRTTQMFFGSSRAFFFSYDYDITRCLAKQPEKRKTDLPLHKLVDPLYFWNRHALAPFIDAGQDALCLPLMQGFVGQHSFVVDSNPPQFDECAKDSVELSDLSYGSSASGSVAASPPRTVAASPPRIMSARTSTDAERRPSEKVFDITLISRRSVKRAGPRYLRRGVDEDGNVANSVETEQILSPSTLDEPWQQESSQSPARTYSFVQVRGSIPLYWTQSPFSLKPVPVIQHSAESNFLALKRHFDRLRREYGDVQVVNLVEKHGVEAELGERFEKSVRQYNDEASSAPDKITVPFEWFDFHSACKGMKFENVSLLMDRLAKKLDQLGCTVQESGSSSTENPGALGRGGSVTDTPPLESRSNIVQTQKGVVRTNCMDCLDRTNVCQSSFAKYVLDAQLKEQGFDMTVQRDQENSWFNTLWADNGDAVSKQYASTAAMKGDYTRTRKRDYRGALTDAGLSLTRFFNGVVNDFFLQTTIDFLLGNVTDKIFDEFEANMMTKDPAMSMQKLREQAIDLCERRVVADESEEFISGWTLLAPHNADLSLTSQPFEEVVLLLTDAALYLCRFDWNLDKLSSFERVELSHILEITVGTYIVSTVSPMQMDEERNVGFLVSYRPGQDDIMRVNTRSLSSMHMDEAEKTKSGGGGGGEEGSRGDLADTLPASIAEFLAMRPPSRAQPAKRIAFKALYEDTSLATPAGAVPAEHRMRYSEKERIASIVAEIERLVKATRPAAAGEERQTLVVDGTIVSLAEARKSTGLFGHLGHSLKKLVWA